MSKTMSFPETGSRDGWWLMMLLFPTWRESNPQLTRWIWTRPGDHHRPLIQGSDQGGTWNICDMNMDEEMCPVMMEVDSYLGDKDRRQA